MIITKNTLKQYFFDWGENHYQIKSIGYGDLSEISVSIGLNYPLLWITPQPCTVSGNEISYNYSVLVADRLLDGNLNIIDGESDTFQICLDMLASLQNNNEFDWELETNATISPFHDRFKDRVVGNFMEVSFKSIFDYDECAIPKTGSPAPLPNECAAAVVLINQQFYGTILSGGTGDIIVKDTDGTVVGQMVNGEWIVPTGSACQPATAVIKNAVGTVLKTESINSGASEDIFISDSTAVIKDSAGTTIISENIHAEASENITVTDSTAVIKNSAGTTINNSTILAQASKNITIADSTAVIKNSAGSTLKSQAILAEASANITINDSSAVIKNSAGTTIKTQSILAEGSNNITINDSSAVVKNSENTTIASASDILAEGSKNISVGDTAYTVKDQDLNTLTSGNLVSAKTGQVINVTLSKALFMKGIWGSGVDELGVITIDADNAGTYTSITSDGSSGTITFSKNGGSYAAFSNPLVLAASDTLNVKRTVTTAAGYYKITGTY